MVVTFSCTAFAMWASVPLDELVKDSDLIVIGTLRSVSEYSKDNTDYGKGTIVIENVIAGNVKTDADLPLKFGDKLQLKWQNSSFIACPRVEHKGNENEKGIWLLTINDEQSVAANYPGRFVSIENLSEIKKYLRRATASKVSKKIAIQNYEEKIYQTAEIKSQGEIAISLENAGNSGKNEYSPFSALLVFLTAFIFFRVFYRDRFNW